MMGQQSLETLFEFPCSFPIKVMADKEADLHTIVADALTQVKVDQNSAEIKLRESSGGKYLSLTAIFTATSKAQLDELYHLLSKHPSVKIVL